MDQALSPDDLSTFEKLTQWPITDFLTAYQSFLSQDVPNIVGFYNGTIPQLNRISNNNLYNLTQQTISFFTTVTANQNVLAGSQGSYRWWILMGLVEEADTFLLKMNNISKWLRSAIFNSNYTQSPQISIKFNQGQTLESIERDVLGNPDWDNAWEGLAIQNNLAEEGYTSDAGFLLKANFFNPAQNITITSIVDNPTSDTILGLDLQAKLQYDPVTQDLVVLTPQQTFLQTVNTLVTLRQRDNPEFIQYGLNGSLTIGSNLNSLNYPSVFRSLSQLMKTDDTIKTFTLINIDQQQDSVKFNFTVESRLGDLNHFSISV